MEDRFMADEIMNVQPNGTITFANEVLETIAGIAVSDIPGIANMNGGFRDNFSEAFGKKRPAKGVRVSKVDEKIVFDVQIIVEYGIKVQDLCKTIQESVFNAIETMTGLSVNAVNVIVQGVKVKDTPITALPEETSDK